MIITESTIPTFQLPKSRHADAGIALHFIMFVISFVVYMNSGWSGYVIFPLTMVLVFVNAFYWFNVDENSYSEYKASYISRLDQLDVCVIKKEIAACGFGTRTERFLTSYLKLHHPDSIEKCQYENFNFFTCEGNKIS